MKKYTDAQIRAKYPFSSDMLKTLYLEEGRTLKEMCAILGIKSPITASKILRAYGISTDNNARIAERTKAGLDDESFKQYLKSEYVENRRSINSIAKEVGVTHSVIAKYLTRYGICLRSKAEQLGCQTGPNFTGGMAVHNGYIEIVVPGHPSTNARGYVYEHRVVMERKIGRYLHTDEVVHHIDGNKSNNSIENLVLLSNKEHSRLHSLLKEGIPYEVAIKGVLS